MVLWQAFLTSVSVALAVLLFSCILLSGTGALLVDQPVGLGAPEFGGPINMGLILFSLVLSLLMWGFTGYHLSLVCAGLTTKEHLKGRRHGARAMLVCQRFEGCGGLRSEVQPRRLVPKKSRATIKGSRG